MQSIQNLHCTFSCFIFIFFCYFRSEAFQVSAWSNRLQVRIHLSTVCPRSLDPFRILLWFKMGQDFLHMQFFCCLIFCHLEQAIYIIHIYFIKYSFIHIDYICIWYSLFFFSLSYMFIICSCLSSKQDLGSRWVLPGSGSGSGLPEKKPQSGSDLWWNRILPYFFIINHLLLFFRPSLNSGSGSDQAPGSGSATPLHLKFFTFF